MREFTLQCKNNISCCSSFTFYHHCSNRTKVRDEIKDNSIFHQCQDIQQSGVLLKRLLYGKLEEEGELFEFKNVHLWAGSMWASEKVLWWLSSQQEARILAKHFIFLQSHNGLKNADVRAQLLFIWLFWRTKEVQKGLVSAL